ncbi:MAG: DUF502 domain-containing protein [Deltaproteobacteria bacterium]|nr:DUF502 domain-containing protein [Deltaproteobacteria bacterium]
MFKSISFRSNLITGVLVLAPIGAVLFIVVWMWNLLMSVSRIIPYGMRPRVSFGLRDPLAVGFIDFMITLGVLVFILVVVWGVGLVSRYYLGKRILESISHFVARVPVLSTVYSTLEQLLKTFTSGGSKNFRRVVQIEYPRKGLYTLAFVTGERDNFLKIYVPTTPNPTSGFYLTIAANEVKDVGISVEDALKEIISMGIVNKDG